MFQRECRFGDEVSKIRLRWFGHIQKKNSGYTGKEECLRRCSERGHTELMWHDAIG